jgi:hypothetical protein
MKETRDRTEAGKMEMKLPELKLPKLPVGIFRGKNLLRTIEIDDPRELLLQTFNRDNSEIGLTAEVP